MRLTRAHRWMILGAIVLPMSCAREGVAQQATTVTASSTTQPSSPQTRSETRPATQPVDVGPAVKMPYTLERFQREGPLAGVVAKVDLTDPRVHVKIALTNDQDPDGAGPAIGQLDTVLSAAQKKQFEIAINASFFKVTGSREILGKKVGYYVGNGTWPAGFLRVDGKTLGEPEVDRLRSVFIVYNDGRVAIEKGVKTLGDDVRYAVSGDSKILTDGVVTPREKDTARHPRTLIGVSEDGKTLVLISVDGRREGWSRGTTDAEGAALLKEFGAFNGLNLDGGGSSTLVVKDAITGAYSVVNRPSERFSLVPGVDSVQRPVADMIGIDIDDE